MPSVIKKIRTRKKTLKAVTPPESFIENQILNRLLSLRGSFFWKNTAGGFFDGKRFRRHVSPHAINGTSDVLGVYRGVFICLEVKSLQGRPTPEQLRFIERVQQSGGKGAVVNSMEKVSACFLEWFGVTL